MFVQILDQVTDQNKIECQHCRYIYDYLSNAIKIWCHQLEIPKEITNYILRGYKPFDKIEELTNYLEQEMDPKQQEETNLLKIRKSTKYILKRIH